MDREVDFIKTSMNVEDLNRLIINLRHTSKICKTQTIQKITRKIAIYKNKRGTENQVEQNLNKCKKLLEEIQILKASHPDHLTKYALNSPLNLEILSTKDLSYKDRAFTRVACHKLFKNFIEEWRREHSDWKSLASFLLTHISRRYKKVKPNARTNTKFKRSDVNNLNIAKSSVVDQSNRLEIQNIQSGCVGEDIKIQSNSSNSGSISDFERDKDEILNSNDDNLLTHISDNKCTDIRTNHSPKRKIKAELSDTTKTELFDLSINTNINTKSKLKDRKKYKNLLLEDNKISEKVNKPLATVLPVDYRDGNILVKEFDLNTLGVNDQLNIGLIDNINVDEDSLVPTKDSFFLRDGEDENDAIDDADEKLIKNEGMVTVAKDFDETEYRGKYPNKFPRKSSDGFNGKGFDRKDDFKSMPVKNNKWEGRDGKNVGAKNNKFNDMKCKNSRNDKNSQSGFNKSNLHPSWVASKKEKSTDCDSALIQLLCVHG